MSGHVAVLASPGGSAERRKRRERGASPPPPPMARRTSLTLASFSTVTAPRLPLSFAEFQRVGSSNPSPPASASSGLTTPLSAASMPPVAVTAARPPPSTTRRTSSRLASLAAASAASNAPPSDRKLPARRRQRTPAKVPRRPTNVGLRKDDDTAEDTPKKKPAIAESSPCCICLSECSQRAGLDSCPHEFCTPCIRQWSAQENSCPLCKQRFTHIIQHSTNGKRRRIAVPHRNQRSDAGRVLDSLLQSLQENGGIGIAIGTPWIVRRGDHHAAVHMPGGELEQFLRRFFVPMAPVGGGHSAATAIDMTDDVNDDDDAVETTMLEE